MTNKYLICSDIDGTLLRQDQTVSEKTRDLIQTLENDGHIFSISTGRMYRSAREVGLIWPCYCVQWILRSNS